MGLPVNPKIKYIQGGIMTPKQHSFIGGFSFTAAVIMFFVAVGWILSQETGSIGDIKPSGGSGRSVSPQTASRAVRQVITIRELKSRASEVRKGVWRGVYNGCEFIYVEPGAR